MEFGRSVQIDWRSDSGGGEGDNQLDPSAAEDIAPPLIRKIKSAVFHMIADRGDFTLFAAFLRRNAPGTWDLIAAAKWLDPDSIDSLKYIYTKISEVISPDEMVCISRVVVLSHQNTIVRHFLEEIAGRTGFIELKGFVFGDVPIRRGYVISVQNRPVPRNQRIRKKRRSADTGRDSASVE